MTILNIIYAMLFFLFLEMRALLHRERIFKITKKKLTIFFSFPTVIFCGNLKANLHEAEYAGSRYIFRCYTCAVETIT